MARRWLGLAAAMWLAASWFSPAAQAQARISAQVTHAESRFDLRAVDPSGTAYALNLARPASEIWASTDNARTWSFRGRHPAGASFRIVTALRDGTLLADAQTAAGFTLARSTDRGATWQDVLTLGQYRLLTPHSIEEAGGTVYLAEYQVFTRSSVPVRLWASTDRGATWRVRYTFEGRRHAHGVRASPDGSLWIFFGDYDAQPGVLRSLDGGLTWATVLAGQEGRVVDAVFVGNDLLFGQDIPELPLRPFVARLTPAGQLTKLAPLPGPSYSIHAAPGGGFLLGTTRELVEGIYAPGDVSAHLFGSPDGMTWVELGSYPRIDASDYARADVYWVLPSGEMVLNLRHVQTLAGGRGYQLLRVSVTAAPGAVSFSDNFDACASTTSLGASWSISGRWYCTAGRARAETANTLALAATAALADVEVSGLVQLANATGSGLVARAGSAGYYAARLIPGGRIELVRASGGTVSVLGSVAASILDVTSYRIRLRVTGRSPVQLEVLRDGVSVLRATDASAAALATGQAGLLSGTSVTGGFFRTQFDDFAVSGSSGTAPPPPPPPSPGVSFSDNFDACTSSTSLGDRWTISGRWYCVAGRARAETAGTLALSTAPSTGDTEVAGLVQLANATGSGLVARAGTSGYYAARLIPGGRIEAVRVSGGTTTVLGSVPAEVLDVTSYRMRLRVTGTAPVQLEVVRNDLVILRATDASSSALPAGQAGLLSGGSVTGGFFRTQFDDFVLAGTAAGGTPPPPPPPPTTALFSDNFEACTSSVDLGSQWTISGRWYCVAGRARGETASGLALARASAPGDQLVQARVQLNGTATGSGVVARAAAGHYYLARMLASGALEIVRVDNGAVTVLGTVPASFARDISYRIALQVSGSATVQLTAFIEGTPVLAATDSSSNRLTSGSAGIHSGGGTAGTFFRSQYDDFLLRAP